MSNLVVGSKAKLKSGGPVFTIESFNHELAVCTWFDDENQLHTREFHVDMLVIAGLNINLDEWL